MTSDSPGSRYGDLVIDILLGVVAVVVGLLFCFGGQFLMRLVIPIWGAFAGFSFGAGLVAGLADEHFLGSVLGWVIGLVFAVIFGVFAYLYYAVAVVLAMGAIGFALGSALMVALGVTWSWVIVFVAMAVAVLLAIAAVMIDMPMIVLIVFSAMGGAAVAVVGLMLMFGAINSADFTGSGVLSHVHDDWWWYVLYLFLAILGVLGQSRDRAALSRGMSESWAGSARHSAA